MSSAQPKLEAELAQIAWSLPDVSVISNVTAQPHEGSPFSGQAHSEHAGTAQRLEPASSVTKRLVEQVTSSVRWEESMRYLLGQGFTRFIELGPGTALSGFMKRIDKNAQMLNVADAASLEATVKALTTPG
jgi:[acyl-carrier-protein] S-malonyltransferase